MNEGLLNLAPKRYLCPYCGEWHDWGEKGYLLNFDDSGYPAIFRCLNQPEGYNAGAYSVYFEHGKCYFSTKPLCSRAGFRLDSAIKIADITESKTEPVVQFTVQFTPNNIVNSEQCYDCASKGTCQLVKLGDESKYPSMPITLGFEFVENAYINWVKDYCAKSKNEPKIATETKTTKGEKNVMANNIFGNINFEFGLNSDASIASTIMGVAVKNGENWRIFDREKNQITDVGDLKIGDLPICIKPTTKLNVGDLIKDSGEYYFVMDMKNGVTQTLNAKTGEMKNIIPVKNILGFNFYSKVVAIGENLIKAKENEEPDVKKLLLLSMLSGQFDEDQGDMNKVLPLLFLGDDFGDSGDFGIKEFAIISMLNGQSGGNEGQMNQLLPLLFLGDDFGCGGDFGIKEFAMLSMLSGQNGGNEGTMNQLIPLLFLEDDMSFGCEDDMMMLLMMTALPAMANNPVMGYLLMKKVMDKKENAQLALPNSDQQLSGNQESDDFDGGDDDYGDDDENKQSGSDGNSDSDAEDGNG